MNTLPKVPGINREKLITMGLDKINQACRTHYNAMHELNDHKHPRYRIHRGLLAQCGLAFDEYRARVLALPDERYVAETNTWVRVVSAV